MNIALLNALKAFVHEQVSTRGYSTPTEYVREWDRKGLYRQRSRKRLFAGVALPQAGAAYFDRLGGQARGAHQT